MQSDGEHFQESSRLELHYFRWVADRSRDQVRNDFLFQQVGLLLQAMLTTSGVTELLTRAEGKRTFIRFYLEPPSTVLNLCLRPCYCSCTMKAVLGDGNNER